MAFPFDLLDLFIPEIAHWMAGKSTSQKRRFQNAGVGLLLIGVVIAGLQWFSPSVAKWAFGSPPWAYFIAFIFVGCGAGLFVCLFLDKRVNKSSSVHGDRKTSQ